MNQRKRTTTSNTEVVTFARSPLPIASGERVAGKYTLVEHYGAGPLGHTYRATDIVGSDVAIKIVARELVPTAAEQSNVVAEVEKLIAHPIDRIAVPLDAGLDHGHAFVVSPWVEGRSLRRVLGAYRDAGCEMPHDEVLGVLEGVVQALRQLHTLMPHGALYPESVQIARSGAIVLTDAGIAGALARARLIDHYEGFPDVMPYLSNEIRGGKRSSAGSDLYSVGALASELLTGDPGAAAAGIAGSMMVGMPAGIAEALAGLVALKASKRAAALPVLLETLARHIGARSVPRAGELPRQRARTEVMHAETSELVAPPPDEMPELGADEKTVPRAMTPTAEAPNVAPIARSAPAAPVAPSPPAAPPIAASAPVAPPQRPAVVPRPSGVPRPRSLSKPIAPVITAPLSTRPVVAPPATPPPVPPANRPSARVPPPPPDALVKPRLPSIPQPAAPPRPRTPPAVPPPPPRTTLRSPPPLPAAARRGARGGSS